MRSFIYMLASAFFGLACLSTPSSATVALDVVPTLERPHKVDLHHTVAYFVLPAEVPAIASRSESQSAFVDDVRFSLVKPEYRASWETHGLSIIDLRRRC